jgi:hypothetical protein
VAFESAEGLRGSLPTRFWRVDAVEAVVRSESQLVSGGDRVRMHGSFGKARGHYNIVRAWIVIGVTSTAGGAALEALIARGHL